VLIPKGQPCNSIVFGFDSLGVMRKDTSQCRNVLAVALGLALVPARALTRDMPESPLPIRDLVDVASTPLSTTAQFGS
jgi:hypothetical protein